MSRSHVGRWTPLHKGLFAVVAGIAVLCAVAIISGDAEADGGVTQHVTGNCHIRIVHMRSDDSLLIGERMPWTLKDAKEKLVAEGTNPSANLSVPEGTYVFKSGNYSHTGVVGFRKCVDKTVLYTFKRRVL